MSVQTLRACVTLQSLLGTYVCTDTPGEFIWQPGTLLQAVTNGCWILLEDIDLAAMDVVSVLIPLLESRTLSVPAHGNVVKAASGFQLFATQRYTVVYIIIGSYCTCRCNVFFCITAPLSPMQIGIFLF